MPIDECPHDFATLTSTIFPDLLKQLRLCMEKPLDSDLFRKTGFGEASILKSLGKKEDFPGLYVFLDGKMPIYVGISQGVIGRLLEHLRGITHFSASLVFNMACSKCEIEGTRDARMLNQTFKAAFDEARKELARCKVAFVEVKNPAVRYGFELYAAMELDCKWNTFETH